MVRITNTAIRCNFTISATSYPTATQVDALITDFYALCSEIFYGVGFYASPDTDTSDPKTLMRATEFEAALKAYTAKKVQAWHDSGISSTGEIIPMPAFNISGKFEKLLKRMTNLPGSRMASIRIYGSEIDDMGVI